MSDGPVTLLYDASGAPISSAFAPLTSRPAQALASPQGGMVVLGSDYGSSAKAQTPKVDASGNLYAVMTTAGGAPLSLQVGASVSALNTIYGPVLLGMQGLTPQPLTLDTLGNLVVRQATQATFSAVAYGVGVSTNKSVLALVNNSTTGTIVRLVAVYAQNTSTTTNTLIASYNEVAFELRPITGVSSTGTAITAVSHDSADTLDANVKLYTGATVTGDNTGPIRRWVSSDFGATAGGSQQETLGADQQGREPWVTRMDPAAKHITVRPSTGIHVKVASTATVGTLDVTFVFMQAAA